MIYLDNPATTFPKPNCLSEEISRCIKKYCGNPGRSSHKLSLKSAERIYETRVKISEIFNSEPENVVFTYNTTYALNIAIKSLLKFSSHVLISDIEHNSVLRPIYTLSSLKLCSYDIFSTNGNDDEILDSINRLIKKETSMLVCSHASNVGSRRLPIEKIGKLCKEKGITFIVDAAQSAGIYKIDVKEMNIDALCFPAHKSLYGPQGIGVVVFLKEKGRSIFEGGTGTNSLELNMPDFLPEKYEPGTLSTPLISGFLESLNWLTALDINNIRAHEEDLYRILLDKLKNNEKITVYEMNDYGGNTLMFNINGIPSTKVSSELDKRDICTRSGFHCSPLAHKILKTGEDGAVRVGFSIYNTRKNVYDLYEAIEDIIISYKK